MSKPNEMETVFEKIRRKADEKRAANAERRKRADALADAGQSGTDELARRLRNG